MKNKTLIEKESGWSLIVNEFVKNSPQVEIRNGQGVVIVVSLGEGYVYRHYGKPNIWQKNKEPGHYTKGYNIHLAISGPLQCTFVEWDDINILVEEAKDILYDIEDVREIWNGTGEEGKFEGLNDLMEELGY
ncbi:MAG: hypothetical protein ACYSW6_04935 [Planctomycetota bacterium]|jgi:hypothetical protein